MSRPTLVEVTTSVKWADGKEELLSYPVNVNAERPFRDVMGESSLGRHARQARRVQVPTSPPAYEVNLPAVQVSMLMLPSANVGGARNTQA
jgi:hypothetical protein